jgi:hypothetical protein
MVMTRAATVAKTADIKPDERPAFDADGAVSLSPMGMDTSSRSTTRARTQCLLAAEGQL